MNDSHSILSLSDEAFGWFVTGFADGEGCFALTKQLPSRAQRFSSWRAFFNIALRDDDAPGLEAVAARMGCGRVEYKKPRHGKQNPVVTWGVFKASELAQIIVPHFEKFPLQMKKARDFAIWKQAIPILEARAWRRLHPVKGLPKSAQALTQAERETLERVDVQLKAIRQYNSDAASVTSILPTPRPNGQLILPFDE